MIYREDEILEEVKEYIGDTYDQHYSTTEDGFQVMDMIKQLGIDKDLLSTPRSVSSFTSEFLDEFEVTGINDLVSFVPSSFTTSFFGVGGSLDIRGSSAENYFRGVKRLNNEGNFSFNESKSKF